MVIDVDVLQQLFLISLFLANFDAVALEAIIENTRGYVECRFTFSDVDQ